MGEGAGGAGAGDQITNDRQEAGSTHSRMPVHQEAGRRGKIKKTKVEVWREMGDEGSP